MQKSKKYFPYSKAQKIAYGKKFTKSELDSYRKGKRMGFLEGIHKKKNNSKSYSQRNYTDSQYKEFYTDIDKLRI